MFRGSSHCSTSPPSHRRISTIHYRIFHTETSTEELQLNTGSTQLLLSNTNTKIYFEVQPTALRPRHHAEGFQLSTIGSFTQGPPLTNYNSTPQYTTPLYNTNLYTRVLAQRPITLVLMMINS